MTGERFVLALDQGTTSSRAIVFDRAGSVVAVAQQEFTQHYPVPGHVEHDAMEIWRTQKDCAAAALAQARAEPADLAAIGITNQRETVLVWDAATGVPVHRAIVWQDRRTAAACAQMQKSGVEEVVRRKTGLRLDPYFSATKLRWILDHVQGARAAAERGQLRAGTIDTWLLWQLTAGKVHATDASNASRTLLYDLRKGDWDDELLALFTVPRSLLPEVRDSISMYGNVTAGLPAAGVRIAGVAGDQQAALFGQACFQPGMAKNTYGTGCFLLLNTGTEAVPSRHDLLTTVAWRIGGVTEYALEGSVFNGGAVVQWLRDELKLVRSAGELDELAASVPDAGGAFLVPAFTGLGAPHWDPFARGLLCGLTRGTGRAQICRAALESIALQSADLMDCMAQDSGIALQELRVDGGAARSAPLLQIQADLLGVPVVRPRNVETTALGACYLAGLAVGFWRDRDEIAQQWQVETTFRPASRRAELAALRAGWRRAVARARGWAGEAPAPTAP